MTHCDGRPSNLEPGAGLEARTRTRTKTRGAAPQSTQLLLAAVLDTYSADFQKCPGWESLRFSLGSFSSMSASWVKVGRSLRSYDQHAERISWEHMQQQWAKQPPTSAPRYRPTRQLTVTSLPRLISARTFLMPSPLPTCQIVASTGWLVIGQSLAWSSYQIVLEKKKGGGGIVINCLIVAAVDCTSRFADDRLMILNVREDAISVDGRQLWTAAAASVTPDMSSIEWKWRLSTATLTLTNAADNRKLKIFSNSGFPLWCSQTCFYFSFQF